MPRSAYGHLVLTPVTIQTLITTQFAKQEIMADFLWSSSSIKLMTRQWERTNFVSLLIKAYTCIEIQVFLKSTPQNPLPCSLSQPASVGLDSFHLKTVTISTASPLAGCPHPRLDTQGVYLQRQKHDLSQQVSTETKAEALWAHGKVQGPLNRASNQGSPTRALCTTQDDSQL